MSLSKRSQQIKEAAMATMGALSRHLKAEGKDVLTLSLGEPDFNMPDFIKDAAIEAIQNNFSHYPPIKGYADVRQAVCNKLKRDNHLSYTAEQIVISTGAKHAIMNALLALLDEGDEVILPAPFWASYKDMVVLTGGHPKVIKAGFEQEFKLSPQQLEEAITEKSKLLIFNSPNNPSGAYYTRSEVEALAEVLEKHPQLYILSDEVYEHFVYGEEKSLSLATFPQLYERCIVINGISKSFAMTGWRIGYLAARADIARACDVIQGQITSGANAVAQRATLEALSKKPEDITEIAQMRSAFAKRRDFVFAQLSDIEGMKTHLPEGAFYIFPDISAFLGKKYKGETLNSSTDFALALLNSHYVSTTPGDAFGVPECLRISYANSMEELEKAMHRIGGFITKLE
jgi:aspartate aminotransferase